MAKTKLKWPGRPIPTRHKPKRHYKKVLKRQLAAAAIKRRWAKPADSVGDEEPLDKAARVAKIKAALSALLGKRTQGLPVTREQSLTVVAAWCAADQQTSTEPAEVEVTLQTRKEVAAATSGLSLATVDKVIAHFLKYGRLYEEDTSKRGHGASAYKDPEALPEGAVARVSQYVQAELTNPEKRPDITRLSVQLLLRSEFKLEWSVDRVGRLLGNMGLGYGPLQRPKGGAPSPARIIQKRIYLIQLYEALRAGDILVWTDESYANVRINNPNGWAPVETMAAASVNNDGPGERVCFVHAISREGLVGLPLEVPLGSTNKMDTAYMIFNATEGGDVDYHGNFENGIFSTWVKNRLIPGLKAQFPAAFAAKPTQRITIVFDNAKYHCVTTENLAPKDPKKRRWHPNGLAKPELFKQLEALGCKTLDVKMRYTEPDGSVTRQTINTPITAAEGAKVGVKGKRANLPEIRRAAEDWLATNVPGVLRNDLEATLEAAGNVRVLWNAPNFPEGCPIENVWGNVKGYAGVLYEPKRNRQTLAAQLWDGFYTDKEAKAGSTRRRGGNYTPGAPGTDNASAAAVIDHVLYKPSGVQLAINGDSELSGSMKKLVVPGKWLALARAAWHRNAMRVLVRKELELMLADEVTAAAAEAEAADEGADEEPE